MTTEEWANEYLKSADEITERIEELRKMTKSVSLRELPVLYQRINSLKAMKNDCLYSVRQIQKYT